MATVSLISYTENAKEILIFTKNTRHLSSKSTLDDMSYLTDEEKDEELEAVLSTIPGPLEFINYIFLIQDVSRASTHQIVRTRTASYAQQSLRVASMEDFRYFVPDKIEADSFDLGVYENTMNTINENYNILLKHGGDIQDIRNILPIATCTNIIMGIDLRNLSQLMDTRLCVRTQGEYQSIAVLMKKCVEDVHPWASGLLLPICVKKGYCNFPRYDSCPIKKKYKHLQPVEDYLYNSVKDDWSSLIEYGYSPQPRP